MEEPSDYFDIDDELDPFELTEKYRFKFLIGRETGQEFGWCKSIYRRKGNEIMLEEYKLHVYHHGEDHDLILGESPSNAFEIVEEKEYGIPEAIYDLNAAKARCDTADEVDRRICLRNLDLFAQWQPLLLQSKNNFCLKSYRYIILCHLLQSGG